jgi:hypothetical protein
MEVDAAFHYKIEPSCYGANAQLIPLVKVNITTSTFLV